MPGREGVPDRAEGRGEGARAGDPLEDPRGDQHGHARGDRAQGTREREQRPREREHAPAAERVGEGADGEQGGGQTEAHSAERPGLGRDVAV